MRGCRRWPRGRRTAVRELRQRLPPAQPESARGCVLCVPALRYGGRLARLALVRVARHDEAARGVRLDDRRGELLFGDRAQQAEGRSVRAVRVLRQVWVRRLPPVEKRLSDVGRVQVFA